MKLATNFFQEDDDDDYDDVGPSCVLETHPGNTCSTETLLDNLSLEIYDDVGPITQTNRTTPAATPSDNDYSSIDENDADLDETYDDVRAPSHEDRVNSLYAGSEIGLRISNNGQESEWEDLEEIVAPVRNSNEDKKPVSLLDSRAGYFFASY